MSMEGQPDHPLLPCAGSRTRARSLSAASPVSAQPPGFAAVVTRGASRAALAR